MNQLSHAQVISQQSNTAHRPNSLPLYSLAGVAKTSTSIGTSPFFKGMGQKVENEFPASWRCCRPHN